MNLRESLATDLTRGLAEAAQKIVTPKAVHWIEHEFLIPETRHDMKLRGKMILQPYQRDALNEILTPDENGRYKYSIVVWSDIKKSAKSTIAAAVNLYRASFTEFGEFYVVANDLKQADSRVAHYMRRAVELNPKMQSRYKMQGYRITTPKGSYIEAIPIDPSGEAGTNADMCTWSELWGAHETDKEKMWCLDEDTDVLTSKGWKKGVDIEISDEIATYRPGGEISWEHPSSIFVQRYNGNMHIYEHKNFSMMCTPDHRLYGRYTKSGNLPNVNKYDYQITGVLKSSALRSMEFNYYHPVTIVNPIGENTNIHKDVYLPPTKFKSEKFIPWDKWVAFMGVYLSEGSTADFRGVPCHVKISQLKEPHPKRYNMIYEILVDAFGDWVKVNKRDGFKICSTELAKITKKYGTTWEKRIPREIVESSPEILEKFINGFWLGDGSNPLSCGSRSFCAASEGLADDLQEVLFRMGYRSSKRPHEKKYWRVFQIKSGLNVSIHKKNWGEIYYSGRVWCPTVSTGLFIARKAGWIFVTGNSEMTIPPMKHGRAFRWIESYAGFTEESNLLYSLYELGVKQGEMLWPDKLYTVTDGEPAPLELYVNRAAGMICLWNTKPRCPWQVKEYYASEEKILPPNQFQRIHRNQWVSSTETFVPMEWFDACYRTAEEFPSIDIAHQPVIISLDAATSNDNFAMLVGCRHPRLPNDILILYSKAWKPVHGKIDFHGDENNPGPDFMLNKMVKHYNVIQVTYDPYQLYDFASQKKKEGLTWFKAFNQGTDRLIADSQLRDVIRDRRLWHRGEPDLREQIQNANAKLDEQDSKVRIVKRTDKMKIDLAVALSMCCHELLRLNL